MKDIEQLRQVIVLLQLVDAGDLDECLRSLPEPVTPEAALRELERRQLMTSYQTGLLRKGETDGLVLGDFKLLYRNASGSFARVYRACSIKDGSMIGLKVLRQRWAKDKEMVAQFRREASVLKRFVHRNIVPIYDIGQQGDYHYFTMEFVEGGNLRDFIKIRRKLSPVEATQCVLDMAEGLTYALSLGATHRDLKMTNVLMSAQGIAKLVDFGLAGDEGVSGKKSGDDVQRALEYATLEKGTGAPLNDPRSDLFFLGAIYYELLTGEPPWPRTKDRQEKKQLSRYMNVTPVSVMDSSIPRCVTEIVDRLMKVNPNERYQRHSEVVQDLRGALAELKGEKPAGAQSGGGSAIPSVMFVERRPKNQDVLREYLSKHGFRVMVSADADRAIARLKTPNTPDCLVLIGDSVGEEIGNAFQQATRASAGRVVVIGLFSEKQRSLAEGLEQNSHSIVLQQPITLRELRQQIAVSLGVDQQAAASQAAESQAGN